MPIRKPNPRTDRKVRKSTVDKRVILFICGVLFLVIIIIIVYFVSREPLVTITKLSSETTREPVGTNNQISKQPLELKAVVTKAKLQLESVDNKDILRAVVEKTEGANNKEIIYKYEWTLNGQPAGDGSDSMGGFKRGDKVAVRITPFKDNKSGQSRALSMEVANTTPKIIEQNESSFDGKKFTTQIKASDPDGDELSYELLSGPQGMAIDSKSGIVNWLLKDNDTGDHTAKVKISDGHGGETVYQFTTTLPKKSP